MTEQELDEQNFRRAKQRAELVESYGRTLFEVAQRRGLNIQEMEAGLILALSAIEKQFPKGHEDFLKLVELQLNNMYRQGQDAEDSMAQGF